MRRLSGQFRADASLPGERLLQVVPGSMGRLASRLPWGTVLVSGTNGKTTTTKMVTEMLRLHGNDPVTNPQGSNQLSGITGELLSASRPGGRIAGDIGVFEVDELWLDHVVRQACPSLLLIGNLFRDQLDRCGEIDIVTRRWSRMLDSASASTKLVLCADDPRVASLGNGRDGVVLYGLDDQQVAQRNLPWAADVSFCPGCKLVLSYDAVYVSQLGSYRCPSCAHSRPRLDVFASNIRLNGRKGSSFLLHTPTGSVEVSVPLPGLYNVYNAVAAGAACHTLGISLHTIADALTTFTPPFGRGEIIDMAPTQLVLVLAKNPTGMSEAVRALCDGSDASGLELIMLLNDSVYDGKDVSWIWDADIEQLAGRVRRVTCGGTRGRELALRLKYAGIPVSAIAVEETMAGCLNSSTEGAGSPIHIVANYTAMLDARDVLVDLGLTPSIWR